MALQETPGSEGQLEGEYIYLNFHSDDQKEGDSGMEKFLVKIFQLKENDLKVALWSKKRAQLFKATWIGHKAIIPDKELTMDVIANTLSQALTGDAANIKSSIEFCDKVLLLKIHVQQEVVLFMKTVVFNFTYKLPLAEMPRAEYVDMRFAEIEKDLVDLKLADSGKDLVDLKLADSGPGGIKAQFVAKHVYTSVEDNGLLLRHVQACGWNATPLNYEMSNQEAYRASFRITSHEHNSIMFGIISNSFTIYNGGVDNGKYCWFEYFRNGSYCKNYQHNGNFLTLSGGCGPVAGSIVTVEFFPQQGLIQYLINKVPAGKHHRCTFNENSYGFAVMHYYRNTRIRLVSIERIDDIF